MDKPYLSWKPMEGSYRTLLDTFELFDSQELSVDFLQSLTQFKNDGFIIEFEHDHEKGYHGDPCEDKYFIKRYQLNPAAFKAAMDEWKEEEKKYTKELAIYEKWKSEQDAVAKKQFDKYEYQKFLALKEKYENKKG